MGRARCLRQTAVTAGQNASCADIPAGKGPILRCTRVCAANSGACTCGRRLSMRYHGGGCQRMRIVAPFLSSHWKHMLIITIKQGKEKSLLAGQPWIYASAIERVDGKPDEK